MTSKEIAEQNEQEFQTAFTEWEKSNYTDNKSYDVMFSCMNFAAQNLIKSKLTKKVYIDIEEKSLDLTCLVFERDIVTHHKRPQKLSSYLYLPMLGILYNHQLQHEEKMKSYEYIVSEGKEASETKKESYLEEYEKPEKVYVVYDRVYTPSDKKLTKEEKFEKLKERESVKVENVLTEEDIKNPDTVMKLLGWELN
ncbi:MAG: hypothetical protein MJZ11_12770 [Lachnospiraceae bacterium]|nr:hypothetical protein [Lachnospiraceae bacterium]